MFSKLYASILASVHRLVYVIMRCPDHNIVLIYTPAIECIAIECSCGRIFWRKFDERRK